MDFQLLIVATIFLGLIGALIFSDKRPAFPFTLALLALLITQSIEVSNVLDNATNNAVITLIMLLLVSSAIERTQIVRKLGRFLLSQSLSKSYFKIFGITALASSILNNTAVVASLISTINNNKLHPASRLLLPLSYAAILGGTITLVGTSTNLIVDSFLVNETGQGFAFFDFALFGIAACLVCGILLYVLLPLLPNLQSQQINNQDYFIEAKLQPDSPLVGKSVEDNGLRNLGDLFLTEIVRNQQLISPVTPDDLLQANDKLIFSGDVKQLHILEHFKGLELYADSNGLLKSNLAEVVVSNRSILIGKTLKSVGFRALFDAAVVAVKRDGSSLSGKLGELRLNAGDVLVLATGADFSSRQNLTKNFFFLSDIQLPQKLKNWQEWLVPSGFAVSLGLAATGVIPLLEALFYLLAIFGLSGVIGSNDIKRKMPLDLWLIITTALSLATAIQHAGVEDILLEFILPLSEFNEPFLAIVGIFLLTLLLTELITNNAAAALMFPIALSVSHGLSIDVLPVALTVALGASASFISPYGYQTNLMIYNAGRYCIRDFVKVGLPVSICYSTTVLTLLYLAYF